MEAKGGTREENSHCVNSVKVPPMILPVAEPKAEPYEKVAKLKIGHEKVEMREPKCQAGISIRYRVD